jgi:hypothetical protein
MVGPNRGNFFELCKNNKIFCFFQFNIIPNLIMGTWSAIIPPLVLIYLFGKYQELVTDIKEYIETEKVRFK